MKWIGPPLADIWPFEMCFVFIFIRDLGRTVVMSKLHLAQCHGSLLLITISTTKTQNTCSILAGKQFN